MRAGLDSTDIHNETLQQANHEAALNWLPGAGPGELSIQFHAIRVPEGNCRCRILSVQSLTARTIEEPSCVGANTINSEVERKSRELATPLHLL